MLQHGSRLMCVWERMDGIFLSSGQVCKSFIHSSGSVCSMVVPASVVENHQKGANVVQSPRPPPRRLRVCWMCLSATLIQGKTERVGRMLEMHANNREEIKEARAGDIVALCGLKARESIAFLVCFF